jgi:hypothetical protein
MNLAQKQAEERALLTKINENLASMEKLLDECDCEDEVYRFYHQSFKVYLIQEYTEAIVEKLQSLAPHLPLNGWFLEILKAGTGRSWSMEDNENWTTITRPMVEAFYHARYFLEMACKYGKELESPPQPMPSGWAAVLYLYNLR